jgi:hypothetical protein
MHYRLIFFCDRNHPDHLYVGTAEQLDHLREVEGGSPRYVSPASIRCNAATSRVAFSYQDFGGADVPIEDAAFSIAPPNWATGGYPTEREWDAAGPNDTAASIMRRRHHTQPLDPGGSHG